MNAHNMHSIEWNVMPNGYRAPFLPISLSLTHTRCGYFTFTSKSHKLNCANKSAQNENTVFISFCLRKTICIWFNVICWTLHVINMAVIGHGHCMSIVNRLLKWRERERKNMITYLGYGIALFIVSMDIHTYNYCLHSCIVRCSAFTGLSQQRKNV